MAGTVATHAQDPELRTDDRLSSGWRFAPSDVGPDADIRSWTTVAVPHTWNAFDGEQGPPADGHPLPAGRSTYYRGGAWYALPLARPESWAGKRVFVRFEAVSLVSDVYLNGVHLGQHRGGFAAFCYELTPALRDGDNLLRVRADNSRFEDVPPLEGDFTVFGGIYRPVHLLVTDSVCISPLESGSSGVFLTLQSVSPESARVEARTIVSNGTHAPCPVDVEITVRAADGTAVADVRQPAQIPADASSDVLATVTIAHPHLWRGLADPYLYQAQVRIWRDGRAVDAVTQPLGLRTVAISQDRGFLLNGEPYPIRGVNRHQDRIDKGWAISDADHDEDHRLILEVGATAIRLAHYQQSAYFQSLCDHSGLLLWQEVPLVNRVNTLPQFEANAKQQLREMILQGYNHPAIAFWGLFNEQEATWSDKPSAPATPLITALQALAKSLDTRRPTVGASWMRQPSTLHGVPDWISFNIYPGWYWGVPTDFGPTVDQLTNQLDGKRIGISEYGAGASPFQHHEGPFTQPAVSASHFHPEEWQAIVHEQIWAAAKANPHLWGTFLWNMFDFAVAARDEGDTPGRNDKGLVTYDRKTKKDAFYFYKANWSRSPVVYITSRRSTERTQSDPEIKVYANFPDVELIVNGRSLGTMHPDGIAICRWPKVPLAPGANRIEAVGRSGTEVVRDECTWDLKVGP